MKVVTEILQDLEILKRLLKHNANLKIRINYYLTPPPVVIVFYDISVVARCHEVTVCQTILNSDNWFQRRIQLKFIIYF